MNLLESKIAELTEQFMGDPELLSVPGSMENVESHIMANKKAKKIIVLIMNKSGTRLNAYSVGLNDWLKAENEGLDTKEIMNNLTVLRAFGIRAPQKAKLQGNVFMEIDLDSTAEYLGL